MFLFVVFSCFLLTSSRPTLDSQSNSISVDDIIQYTQEHRNAYSQEMTRLRFLNTEEVESADASFTSFPEDDHVSEDIEENLPEEGKTILEINEQKNLTKTMYQGDVILTQTQLEVLLKSAEQEAFSVRKRRQAYRDFLYPLTTWEDGVFYQFHSSANAAIKSAFRKAVRLWARNTCVNFYESSTAPNRLLVFNGDGCYSYIGRVTGVQPMSLGPGCARVATAAHELAHAMGFFHTQSRSDRDNYIRIMIKNIERGFVDQFGKESRATDASYGVPYDYGSVMHYGAKSASANDKATMVAKNPKYQYAMGSDIVSFYDISLMNKHYKCHARCPPATSANCLHGGFPHPRNCAKCICPDGYGGLRCDRRPAGCGTVLRATNTFKILDNTVGDGTQIYRQDFSKCHFLLQAPKGRRVEMQIKSFSGITKEGCVAGGFEIKSQPDIKNTGYRYCSAASRGTRLFSSYATVPIITFNRYNKSRVQILYRVAPTLSSLPNELSKNVTEDFLEQFDYETILDAEPDDGCINCEPGCDLENINKQCTDESTRTRCPITCAEFS